ncbi:MAG: mechanosensitive ion channel family protein [Ginsengibacter sp.]
MESAYNLISDKLILWWEKLIRLLPNIALAIIILFIGFFITKWLRKVIKKVSRSLVDNPTIQNLFTNLIYIALLLIVLFAALTVLNLSTAVTSILGAAGLLGFAFAFAFQDIAANFMSGIFISLRKPLHVKDIVKLNEYMGEVIEINMRDTILKTFQGQMVIIPNKMVLQNPIENYTLLGKRRMDLVVGVSYGDDLVKVKQVTLDAVKNIDGLTDDPSTLFFNKFDGSSINFVLRLWVNTAHQVEFLQVQSDAIINIKAAFDKNNISIPFPITTLDYGIKGGVSLADVNEKKAAKA